MKKINNNKTIIYCLVMFFLISVVSIYCSLEYITIKNILLKQIFFYLISTCLIVIILKTNKKYFIKYSLLIYIFFCLLLGYVLLFGEEINGSKAWINLPIIGGFQPSEFMKIGLILVLANIINDSINKNESDFIIILKSFIAFLIPTILTFLEPDTGAVIVYFIITIVMLFVSGIKKRWFIILIIIIIIIVSTIFYLYYFKQNLFINILGSNFFYRIDRIFDWTNSSGMQLENSVISISSGGFLGHGFNNIPLYFPELHTDFIFASFLSCFGILGLIFAYTIFIVFDYQILNIGINSKSLIDKLIVSSIALVIIYQQIQNTAMVIGILPITGITLPFISSGGSSLISFMLLIGIVLNINKKSYK